jgi:hypothetical protein
MKKILLLAALLSLAACDQEQSNSDDMQNTAQAKSLAEMAREVGMPAITNFQEKRMLKQIYEMRDQGIGTFSYIQSMQGCLVYLGPSVGYGVPYATQYSNPQVMEWNAHQYLSMPQAEPNGLFMPAEAHGTWVMLKDPNSDSVKPVYIEPDVIVSPFKLDKQLCH